MLLHLAILLLTGVSAFAAISYAIFWCDVARKPASYHPTVRPGAPGRVRMAARAFFLSVANLCLVVLAYPLGFIPNLWNPREARGRAPVILAHGLWHNASAWLAFKPFLALSGFTAVYCPTFNTLGRSLPELAAELKALVRDVSARHGGAKAALIGHSLGGLLTRSVLADPETAGLVRRAVILGAPNRGSTLAPLAVGRAARDLGPGSAAIEAINAAPGAPDIPKLNLRSPVDNLVLPGSSLEPPGPDWQDELTVPVSHVSMLFSPTVLRKAAGFLSR
jgi:triacylglycerol esterase/lipase EstA (alpha/beta hydrolase family)